MRRRKLDVNSVVNMISKVLLLLMMLSIYLSRPAPATSRRAEQWITSTSLVNRFRLAEKSGEIKLYRITQYSRDSVEFRNFKNAESDPTTKENKHLDPTFMKTRIRNLGNLAFNGK